MAIIEFNRDNHAHRKMLALAMREYAKAAGLTLAGSKNHGSDSLLENLKEAGCATNKSNLDRVLRAPDPEEFSLPYPRIARDIALFLQGKGFFPPAQEVSENLQMLPLFFGGFAPGAISLMQSLEGTYTGYQRSNISPDKIIFSTFVIGSVNEWNYAEVTETIEIIQQGRNKLVYEGIAFADQGRTLTVIARERNLKHPRFYTFEDADRPNGMNPETMFGTFLGGARLRPRHLSPIALYRGREPKPEAPVPVSDMSPLPEYVRRYLSRPLMPGPENGEPESDEGQQLVAE